MRKGTRSLIVVIGLAVVVFVETAAGRVEQALRLPLHRK